VVPLESDERLGNVQKMPSLVVGPRLALHCRVLERLHQAVLLIMLAPKTGKRTIVPVEAGLEQSGKQQRLFLVVMMEAGKVLKERYETLQIEPIYGEPRLDVTQVGLESVESLQDEAVLSTQ
jgi:hypothetical protein